jgi:hypothetical protein
MGGQGENGRGGSLNRHLVGYGPAYRGTRKCDGRDWQSSRRSCWPGRRWRKIALATLAPAVLVPMDRAAARRRGGVRGDAIPPHPPDCGTHD